MKASRLAKLLADNPKADVFFKDADGFLHEITLVDRPATFDGFDTVYDEGFDIIATD